MPIAVPANAKVWRRRAPVAQFAISAAWLAGAAVFIACWQFISEKTIWPFVLDAPAQAMDLAVRMVPPEWSFMGKLWRPLWDLSLIHI